MSEDSNEPEKAKLSEDKESNDQPPVQENLPKEDENGSLKTEKSSASSSKAGRLEKVWTLLKLTKPSEQEPDAKRKSLPEKLTGTSKKSPDYMKEKMENRSHYLLLAKQESEMKLNGMAALNDPDDRLEKSKDLKIEAKKDSDGQSPNVYVKIEVDDGLDLVKRESIEIIKKKVLSQAKVKQPAKAESKDFQITYKQNLDTDEDVFSVIDSKDIVKKKEEKPPKERVADAGEAKKEKKKKRRRRRRRHGRSKDSKLVNLLTKRKKLQKVLEDNLLIKKIKENCELRSGHIKTDIRLGYKNHSIVIEPVVNSDLLFADNAVKTELEKLIEASRRSADKRSVRKGFALKDASLMINSIEKGSRILQDLNKEIESELNSLNKIKLEKRAKVARGQSIKRKAATDKSEQQKSFDDKREVGAKKDSKEAKGVERTGKDDETRVLKLRNCLLHQKDPVVCEGYRVEVFSSSSGEPNAKTGKESPEKAKKNHSGSEKEPDSDADDEESTEGTNRISLARDKAVMNSEIRLREILRNEIRANQEKYNRLRERRQSERSKSEKLNKPESNGDGRGTEASNGKQETK